VEGISPESAPPEGDGIMATARYESIIVKVLSFPSLAPPFPRVKSFFKNGKIDDLN
jgi:hypothetical protein